MLKIRTIVADMLAGADSINDPDLLRAGVTPGAGPDPRPVEDWDVPAHVRPRRQLHKASRRILTDLAGRLQGLVGADDVVFVDTDDTIESVHGYQKQGAGAGYTGVRGLGKAAGWHLNRAMTTLKTFTRPDQQVWVRADSARSPPPPPSPPR